MKKYIKAYDIPNIENYIALYGAIKSEKPISVNEALSRVGIKTEGDIELSEVNDTSKITSEQNITTKIKKQLKRNRFIYTARCIYDGILYKGTSDEVACKLKVTAGTIRVAGATGSKIKGHIYIEREEII